MLLSAVLPENVRNQLRHRYDSFFCKSFADKETIGLASQWTILKRGMNPNAIIYSGGVGEDITFELELIRRFGPKIHIFDPSPVAKHTIGKAMAQANGIHERLLFEPKGLAATETSEFAVGGGDGQATWLKMATSDEGTGVLCTTIPKEMHASGDDHIDLLKIDIEGFEYEVLESCFEAKIDIKQICVEFHDFFPEIPKMKTTRAIKNLERNGFILIHRHRHDHTFYNRNYL